MTVSWGDEDDDEDNMSWLGGFYGGEPPPEPPKYQRHMYIHECPFCHVVHEKFDSISEWCEDHADLKLVWARRKSPDKDDGPWACQGCEKCEAMAV